MTLEFKNLGIGYDSNLLFCALNAKLDNGESLAIMGCNGAGKSTFIKTIALRHKMLAGEVLLNNQKLCQDDIAYMPQSTNIVCDIGISAAEFVKLSMDKPVSRKIIENSFKQYGIDEIIDKPLNVLSGGQLNRLQILRIELLDKKILLFDEPFANLDTISKNILIDKISFWKKIGKIVIISVHDERISVDFDHFITLDGTNAHWEQKMKNHNKDCVLAGCAIAGC